MPKVLNKRTDDIPPDAVYVGRPTKFGNPYMEGRDGNRDEVCDKFGMKMRVCSNEFIAEIKRELKGKDLVCWCAPLRCHADELLRIANATSS